jgi:hypothetical protein
MIDTLISGMETWDRAKLMSWARGAYRDELIAMPSAGLRKVYRQTLGYEFHYVPMDKTWKPKPGEVYRVYYPYHATTNEAVGTLTVESVLMAHIRDIPGTGDTQLAFVVQGTLNAWDCTTSDVRVSVVQAGLVTKS